MSDERDALLDSLLVERFGPVTRLLAEKSHDLYAERRRALDDDLDLDLDDQGETNATD